MVLLWLLNLLLLLLFGFGRQQKPVLLGLFTLGAASLYFQQSFGVLIDKAMLQNALETDPAEAKGLLSFSLFWHLAQWLAFPLLLCALAPVQKLALAKRLQHQLSAVLAVLLVTAALGAGQLSEFAPLFRNYRSVK